MLREHAPLIAVAVVVSVLFYLVFRDLRGLRAQVEAACLTPVAQFDEEEREGPAASLPAAPEPVAVAEAAREPASAVKKKA